MKITKSVAKGEVIVKSVSLSTQKFVYKEILGVTHTKIGVFYFSGKVEKTKKRVFFFLGKSSSATHPKNFESTFFLQRYVWLVTFSAHFWSDFYLLFFWKSLQPLTHSIEKAVFYPASENKDGFFIHSLNFS